MSETGPRRAFSATFWGGPLHGQTMMIPALLHTVEVLLPPDPPLEVRSFSSDESPTAAPHRTGFYDLFWKDVGRGTCKYTYRDPS